MKFLKPILFICALIFSLQIGAQINSTQLNPTITPVMMNTISRTILIDSTTLTGNLSSIIPQTKTVNNSSVVVGDLCFGHVVANSDNTPSDNVFCHCAIKNNGVISISLSSALVIGSTTYKIKLFIIR